MSRVGGEKSATRVPREDRLVEDRRRQRAAVRVDGLQVLAEELVEEQVVVRGEIAPVPPEPIAPLGRVDLAQRVVVLLRRERAALDLLLEKGARLAEQLPRAVFLRVADPDIEVAPDPRAGVQRGDLARRRVMPEVILDRARMQQLRLRFDAAVERAQKALAAIGKGLPRVLAIEDQRHHAGILRDDLGDLPQVMQQVIRPGARLVFRRHEADEIRERLFAEERIHRRAVVPHAPALEELQVIDRLAGIGGIAPERVEEVVLVGAEVLDARSAP